MRAKDGTVVVTGGASGIGAGVVATIAAAGHHVVVADLDGDAACRVADAAGGIGCQVDVRDRAEVRALFAGLEDAPVGLVTCAGGAARRSAIDIDEQMWAECFQLNAGGFLRCAQEAARRSAGSGRPLAIVHVASSLWKGPAPGLAHFAAAKAASLTLVRCLAQEWAGAGVRVNAVVPGVVATPATGELVAALQTGPRLLTERIPLGRVGQPRDIAGAVAWLLSDEAEWVTGSVLTVDGGMAVGL